MTALEKLQKIWREENLSCPHCHEQLSDADLRFLNETGRCKKCGKEITLSDFCETKKEGK
jgi:tRNA(Ile2) C34 agmatinyltransferase TiaS